MASNQPAYAPSPVTAPTGEWPFGEPDGSLPASEEPAFFRDLPAAPDPADTPREPRLPRQRTALQGFGGAAVGSTVLGIAATMAAVGGGVATAAEAPTAPPATAPGISVPDSAPTIAEPSEAAPVQAASTEAAPADIPADTPAQDCAPAADPGEALCNRLIAHVTEQREAAARAEREAAERAAAKEAAARKVREQAAAAKAEAAAKAKAEAAAKAKAEAERLARLAVSYVKPVASYTLTNAFGESSNMWATHTGQDFAAPTGTPVHAIHTGTVVAAGWAGSYGYRVVLRLDDGTELWYCHLSTVVATSGKVTTGDTVGRVGATGNVPGPHLHLEVRPDGGAPVDPVPWLQSHDVAV